MADLIVQSFDQNTIARVATSWDLLKESIDGTLYLPKNRNYFNQLSLLMGGLGSREIVSATKHSIFEQEQSDVLMTSSTTIAISGGQYTLILPAGEIDPTTGFSAPMKHEQWQRVSDGEEFQIVDKPSQNTIVFRPSDSAFTGAITAGDTFFKVDTTVPEGSGKQQTKAIYTRKKTFHLQAYRNEASMTGEYKNNQLWVETTSNGQPAKYTNSLTVQNMHEEHYRDLCTSFFAGKKDNNYSQTTSFQTTKGAVEEISENGQTVNTGGTLDVTDLYSMEALLSAQDPSITDYAILLSGKMSRQIESTIPLTNVISGTNRVMMTKESYDAFWGDDMAAMGLSTTLSWSNLTVNFRTFHFIRMQLLDNPRSLGATGSVYLDTAVVIPHAKGDSVADGYGVMGKYIRLITKSADDFMNSWDYGALSSNKDQYWAHNFATYSLAGWKFVYSNCMGVFKP